MSTDENVASAAPGGRATTAPHGRSSPDGKRDGKRDGKQGRGGLLLAVCDVVAPIAVFYICRVIGFDDLTSLLISAVAPLGSIVYQAVTARRLNGFAIFVGSILLLNIAIALTSADARTLLARDGWITGLAGLFFIGTLWGRRPIVYSLVRPIGEGRLGPAGVPWDEVWDRYAIFRRVFRVLTVIWGVGLVIDAAIRVVFAYALPIDIVPAANGIQYLIVYVILQIISQVYFKRSGLMRHPDFASFHRKKKA